MKLLSAILFALLLGATGCSKQEPARSVAPPAPPAPSLPKLQPGGETTAPPTPAAAAAPAPSAVDVATMQRPVNSKGDPMSDVELLNQILHNYQEARATQTPSRSRAYKTEAEQMAAETAALKAVQAPIKDLSELVKAGVIKALPTPPAGKKFAIDPQSQKVVLVNGP